VTEIPAPQAVADSDAATQLSALARTPGVTGNHRFADLLALAAGESAFKPHAFNRHTGATGPFQFIKSTWLSLLRDHGTELGVKASLIEQIVPGAHGRLTVADPEVLKSLLALRNDLALSTRAAAKYLDENAATLQRLLRRPPSEAEIQLSFLLGAKGATRLIHAAAADPNVSAAEIVPHAAAANRTLFFHHTGAARTAAQTIAFLTSKLRADAAKFAAYAAPSAPATRRIDA
jgi:hypothetical protein